MTTLDEAIEQMEAALVTVDAYIATHYNPRMSHHRAGLVNLLAAARDEPNRLAAEAAKAERRDGARAPKYDQHDLDQTARLVAQGVLPEGSTPEAFHEWQAQRRKDMAGRVSVPKPAGTL